MNHAHLPELLGQAIRVLKEGAESLRRDNTFNGQWDDGGTLQAEYEHQMQLAEQLQEALPEFAACHQVYAGLVDLLQSRDEILLNELTGLFPEKTA